MAEGSGDMGTHSTATPQQPGVWGHSNGGDAPHTVTHGLPGFHPGHSTQYIPALALGHGRTDCATGSLLECDKGASGTWHTIYIPVSSTMCAMAPDAAHRHMGVCLWNSMSSSLTCHHHHAHAGPAAFPIKTSAAVTHLHWHPVSWQPGPSTCPSTSGTPTPGTGGRQGPDVTSLAQ